jgi:hypothetical protein
VTILPVHARWRSRPYWHGCNYPWSTDGTTVFYGLDFGQNIWGAHLGVSTRRAAVARDCAEMAALGFLVARWFVFADGRSGIVYDERGFPAGHDPQFFVDLDAALEIAGAAGMQLALVLLDHRWMFEGVRESLADPVTGAMLEARLPHGRAAILHTAAGAEALFERVIDPLVRRYGPSGERADLAPVVFAYELMNEPDFVIEEWERDLSAHVARPLRFEVMARLVARLSAVVHHSSTAATTLGCARLHNLWAWDDAALGLDLLQLHSYPDTKHRQRDADVFGLPAASLGMSRPVLLGEFPGNTPLRHPPGASPPPTTLEQYLDFAVAGGYAGAWPWSFSGTDHYGGLPVEALRRFVEKYPELVNPRALAASTGSHSVTGHKDPETRRSGLDTAGPRRGTRPTTDREA